MARATRLLLVVHLGALASACAGGFDTPDLGAGTVQGRLMGANAGGYVYPFGRPDLKKDVGADGQFSMENVPVETTEIVVVDGPDPVDKTRRAQLVSGIEVEGAELTELGELDATGMPLAGSVAVAVQPSGGAIVVSPKFTVVGTELVDVVADSSGLAVLAPLPAGLFELTASMAGFETNLTGVQVVPATTMQAVVPLAVDSQATEPGCAATSSECRNGLVCNPADGYCYECLQDVDCQATHGFDSTCSGNRCQPGASTTTGRGICEPCSNDGECADGACVAQTAGGELFCTRVYSGWMSCPAGFVHAIVEQPTRDVCVPVKGCAAYRIDFGSACFDDATCGNLFSLGAPDVICHLKTSTPGYCTGFCQTDADCVVPGYACSGGMSFGYCIKSTTPPI